MFRVWRRERSGPRRRPPLRGPGGQRRLGGRSLLLKMKRTRTRIRLLLLLRRRRFREGGPLSAASAGVPEEVEEVAKTTAAMTRASRSSLSSSSSRRCLPFERRFVRGLSLASEPVEAAERHPEAP